MNERQRLIAKGIIKPVNIAKGIIKPVNKNPLSPDQLEAKGFHIAAAAKRKRKPRDNFWV